MEIKGYLVNSYDPLYVCKCEGVAHDIAKHFHAAVDEVTVILSEGTELTDEMFLYSCDPNHDWEVWYDSQEAALAAALKKYPEQELRLHIDSDYMRFVIWYNDVIDPLPSVFEVEMSKTDDGRYLTRINVHPEKDGKECIRQKVFFPDRKWTGPVYEGTAIVKISREFEKYGFLTGRMKTYEGLTKEELINFVLDRNVISYINTRYIMQENGKIIFCTNRNNASSAPLWIGYVKAENDSVHEICFSEDFFEHHSYEEGTCSQCLFQIAGMNLDLNIHLNDFSVFEFNKPRLAGIWHDEDYDFNNDLLREYIELGIVVSSRFGNEDIWAITLNQSGLIKMLDFSEEENKYILEFISRKNQHYEDVIKARIQKGTLQLRTPICV